MYVDFGGRYVTLSGPVINRPGQDEDGLSDKYDYQIWDGGDSGGPWFYYPGTLSTITGAGIHTAGGGSGYSSTAIYMPIDYMDDRITSVNTIKQ